MQGKVSPERSAEQIYVGVDVCKAWLTRTGRSLHSRPTSPHRGEAKAATWNQALRSRRCVPRGVWVSDPPGLTPSGTPLGSGSDPEVGASPPAERIVTLLHDQVARGGKRFGGMGV
jgi:hypothetical protein